MSTSIAQDTGRGTSLHGSVAWWIVLVSVVAALAVGGLLGRVSAPTQAQPSQVVAVHHAVPAMAGQLGSLKPTIDHQGVPRHKWGPTQKPLP